MLGSGDSGRADRLEPERLQGWMPGEREGVAEVRLCNFAAPCPLRSRATGTDLARDVSPSSLRCVFGAA